MNTRGLMELVVLNIGLDLGVISPTLVHDDGRDGDRHHAGHVAGVALGAAARRFSNLPGVIRTPPCCRGRFHL